MSILLVLEDVHVGDIKGFNDTYNIAITVLNCNRLIKEIGDVYVKLLNISEECNTELSLKYIRLSKIFRDEVAKLPCNLQTQFTSALSMLKSSRYGASGSYNK